MPGVLTVLKSIFGGNNPFDSIANAADRFITTKQEKLEFAKELEQIQINAAEQAQRFISERHKVDMASDSWLSKNIRPLTMIFLLFVVSLLSLTDGNIGEFSVEPAYVSLYESMLMAVFSFYFVGRALMHLTEIIKKPK